MDKQQPENNNQKHKMKLQNISDKDSIHPDSEKKATTVAPTVTVAQGDTFTISNDTEENWTYTEMPAVLYKKRPNKQWHLQKKCPSAKKIHKKKEVENEISTIAEAKIKQLDQKHALQKAEFEHNLVPFSIYFCDCSFFHYT